METPPSETDHVQLAEAFLAASRDGDLDVLPDVPVPDVVRRVDRVLVPNDLADQAVSRCFHGLAVMSLRRVFCRLETTSLSM